MSYRFHPLRDFEKHGVVTGPDSVRLAEFMSPKEAKSRVLARQRKEELALLKKLCAEYAMPERYPER